MTTDGERRGVARKLRDRPVARNIQEAYVAIVQTVGVGPCLLSHDGESGDRFDAAAYAEALERLAELIDPHDHGDRAGTCKIVTRADEYGDLTEMHSCCGDLHTRDAFTGRPFAFCPSCGARVMEVGE